MSTLKNSKSNVITKIKATQHDKKEAFTHISNFSGFGKIAVCDA